MLRWPMRSPLRLGSVVVGVIVVVWVISKVTGGPEPTTTAGHPHGGHAASAQPSSAAPSSKTPVPSPVPTAVGFVTAWARPELPQAQWLAGIDAAHPSESLAEALSTTDPRSVPATKVVGTPKIVEQTADEARVQVGTDAKSPTVTVVLAFEDNAWSVSNILPGG
ncbi:MAG: hypothetical protein J2O46_02545 [Nocardioides sp.]|nr:hypothetical protein [Nocardioides sp.]